MKFKYLIIVFLISFSYEEFEEDKKPIYSIDFSDLLKMVRTDIIDTALLYLPKRNGINILKMCNEMLKMKEKYSLNEAELVFLVYKWIATNIKYDCLNEIDDDNQSAENAYNLGYSRYKGFSSLFKTMCNYLKFESEIITGIIKKEIYENNNMIEKIDYTWNYVILNGTNYLFDVSMAAGVCYNNEFMEIFRDFYFGAKPEIFIRSHFPDDNKMQFLSEKISLSQFSFMALLNDNFFKLGFKTIFPDTDYLEENKNYEFKLTYDKSINYPPFKIKGLTIDINEKINDFNFDEYSNSNGIINITYKPKKEDVIFVLLVDIEGIISTDYGIVVYHINHIQDISLKQKSISKLLLRKEPFYSSFKEFSYQKLYFNTKKQKKQS